MAGAHGRGLPTSLRFAGGLGAPRAARRAVQSALAGQISDRAADDVALIVSELVTNSVRHARAATTDVVIVNLLLRGDRLRLAVLDGGSQDVPHIAERAADEPGGLGLRLVDQLATEWGVTRDGDRVTRVWCELPVAPYPTRSEPS